ncbi:MAG: hypothetical protein IJY25_02635 [Bacilli bacterium]|nr:hypothetical protein [Bacilli bacterium]
MSRDRNKRLIIVIALISVVSITIGFAAVSSSLLIKTGLSVDPNANAFSVVFSTSSTEAVEGTVEPVVVPDTLEAAAATITNDGTFPTISGIDVVFTEPGQSVTYSFYALNNGKYDAYLTSIVLQSLTSGAFKKCIPGEGATTESVNNACNSIDVKVTAGNLEVTSTTLGIENHQLLIGASEVVTITIEYREDGSTADGPVEVNFGNIYLTYGTQMTDENPTLPEPGDTICVAKDSSKAGSTATGTEYQCDVDSSLEENFTFYVLSTEGSKVNLLMNQNIDDGTYMFVNGEEDSCVHTTFYACQVGIDSYAYASRPTVLTQAETFASNWNNISNYANVQYSDKSGNYTTTLTGKARLATYDEIAELCPTEGDANLDRSGIYTTQAHRSGCPSWLTSTSYWTMDSSSGAGAWAVTSEWRTLDDYNNQTHFGIRPVITVSISDLS